MAGMRLPQPLSLTRFRRNQYLPRVYGPVVAPLVSCSFGEFGVSEALNQQIDRLQEIYKSELDPQGRAFVPLADAHRRLGDLGKALEVIQEGLGTHPDFASAHMVAGWVHRSRKEPDDAMRSFERVLSLDAENLLARAAIAELIDDQRAEAYRDKVAARGSAEPSAAVTAEDERPVVPIASLAPGAPAETIAAPELVPYGDQRPVVPIASLAPGEPDETLAAPGAAPDPILDGDARPVVPIASLAPEIVPDGRDPQVVPITSLAPDGGEEGRHGVLPAGTEIYTETLAELYAGQGATEKAIEVYRKLIANDPDNEALGRRLTELESLEPDADGAPAELDVGGGPGSSATGSDERQAVPIESLAPDG